MLRNKQETKVKDFSLDTLRQQPPSFGKDLLNYLVEYLKPGDLLFDKSTSIMADMVQKVAAFDMQARQNSNLEIKI